MKNETKTRIAIGDLRRWLLWASTHVIDAQDSARLRAHTTLWTELEAIAPPPLSRADLGRFLHWLHSVQTHLDNVSARDEASLRKHLALWGWKE